MRAAGGPLWRPATGSDHLFDIWSPLGHSVGTAAATETSNWLTDLFPF